MHSAGLYPHTSVVLRDVPGGVRHRRVPRHFRPVLCGKVYSQSSGERRRVGHRSRLPLVAIRGLLGAVCPVADASHHGDWKSSVQMCGLRDTSALHLNRERVVVMLPDPARVRGDRGIQDHLAGRDRPEIHLRRLAARGRIVKPRATAGDMPSDLVGAMRCLPDPRTTPESVVLARSAMKRIDMRGHHHIPEGETGLQSTRHSHEKQGGRGEFGDGTFGEHRSGLVALADQGQRHPTLAVGEPADLEPGALLMPVKTRVG